MGVLHDPQFAPVLQNLTQYPAVALTTLSPLLLFMSLTRLSPAATAARLVISPSPTTLGESTAVLKRLQTFGRVISFTAPSTRETRQGHLVPENDQSEVDVVFSSRETFLTAQAAGAFTVKVNHDLPDPVAEDPYNVRYLQSRKQPTPKTMVCRIEKDAGTMFSLSGQNILSSGFSPSVNTRLYQSLTDLKAPKGLAAGLGVFHVDKKDFLPTPDLVDPVSGLEENVSLSSTQ